MHLRASKRYSIHSNTLELYVKKSPLPVRGTFLVLAILCIALPLLGIGMNMIARNDFHIRYVILLGVFSLIGFFFIRLYLWNTYGKEVIVMEDTKVSYYADYRYFKGNQQQIVFETLTFDFTAIGFQDEALGNLLIIASDTEFIQSGVNIPIADLTELIQSLERMRDAEISIA